MMPVNDALAGGDSRRTCCAHVWDEVMHKLIGQHEVDAGVHIGPGAEVFIVAA